MLVESGYDISLIPYHRPERAAGRSNNNLFTSLDFALLAFAGSAKLWLRLPIIVSVFVCGLSGLTFLAAAILFALARSPWGALLYASLELGFGTVLFFLGLIGDQVRVISERTRNVPLVIEKERVNF